MTNASEESNELEQYAEIVSKLHQKTKAGRLLWEPRSDGFSCSLRESTADNFSFFISEQERTRGPVVFLSMYDADSNAIFRVHSTSLPTSPTEETLSDSLRELYTLARRQALKIDKKLRSVSDLLDRT